ncbi:hypothetical protein TRFO_02428 [Tritrichomonas foetus]|uniref:PAS domain-containing protein n=1 Tax=Tritrichomonas foetus TaxID=1144522 RepID=A0A1J4J3E6_9EUKA|nr:hypothetical protein TRFO_02428 [Tritrichomonas foetus]|eukprot:OHS93882.1 hypothetical protein TRFO_02428 [Tritrichomonas foetus]
MISPTEKISAFSQHRLSKKQDGTTFEIAGHLVISPAKYSIFTFIHNLNRTIVSMPLIFWVNLIISFLQLAMCVCSPYNLEYWGSFPEILPIIKVFIIVLRFIPFDAPSYASYVAFGIYCVLILGHFILFIISFYHARSHQGNRTFIQVLFVYSFFINPILRSSMTSILSFMLSKMVTDPSFGNFFLSLASLAFLVLLFFNCGFSMFAMSSAPNPNMSNPCAAWAPDAWCSVHFEAFLLLCFMMQELTKHIPKFGYGIYLFIFAIIVGLFFAYILRMNYLISYTAVEFILGLYLATSIFYLYLGVFGVLSVNMPLYAFLIVWILLPGGTFFLIRGYYGHKVRRVLHLLDECGTPTETCYDDNDYNYNATTPNVGNNPDENAPLLNESVQSSIFASLNLKSDRDAISAARIACFCNHPFYEDLSLIKYLIEAFPKAQFSFIHLAYLMPTQYDFVNKCIDTFVKENKPNFITQCILFQMKNGIMESSNELPPSIRKEISQQLLLSMKCQQLLTKYWTTCYKGDITQMARHAFIMYRHINDLNKRWITLVHRYPFSLPVLKEYINYLQSIGTQHKLADSIIQNRPQLVNADNTETMENEIKASVLSQSIEEAVDRRPIFSLSKVKISFTITVIIAIIFLVAATVIGMIASIRIKRAANCIFNIDTATAYMSHIPNLYDDMVSSISDSRLTLFLISTEMGNLFNQFLRYVPTKVFQDSEELTLPFFLNISLFIDNSQMSAYSSMLHMIYYSRAMAYAPANDSVVNMVTRNILNTHSLMNSFSLLALDELEKSLNSIISIAPYFYILCWVLLLVVMIPLVYFSLSSLKQEITYLFALYLTIPRSYINKLIESGNNAKADRRAAEMLTSSSFVHTTRQFGQTEDKAEDDENIADGFKMLVSDSSQSFSVFPRGFIAKCSGMMFIITAIVALIACISFFIFTTYTKKTIKCLYTIHHSATRMILSSIIMHGVSSKNDYPIQTIDAYLKALFAVNSALLYSSDSYNISDDAISSSMIHQTQYGVSCNDTNNNRCKNMMDLFDTFVSEISNLTSLLVNNHPDQVNITGSTAVRRLYNDYLATKLVNFTETIFIYTKNTVNDALIIDIVLFVVTIFFLIFIIIFTVKPIFNELIDTIQSVKLPLKHIAPIDLADLPKLMQYLQGECDWKRGPQNEKSKEESGGNTFLNAMLCPFAIFEEDLALLFANSAFYTMLGTTREATVGLQMEEIFSPVMNFKENENHPFNSLLETVQQLRRGVSPVRYVEITTEIGSPNQTSSPVLVRLVGIGEDSSNDNQKEGKNEDLMTQSTVNLPNGNKDHNEQNHNMKAKQYAVFITDLTQRIMIEEKLKYETDISQKLVDGAISRSFASSLRDSNKLMPKVYNEIPMIIFTLRFPAEEDGDDDLLVACSQFLRTSTDMSHTFSSITKLTHSPPSWVYAAGMNSTDQNDLAFNTGELANFALSIIEVISNTSSTTCSLSALMHIGEIQVLPIDSQLPFIEVFGSGYLMLKYSQHLIQGNTLYATQEASAVLETLPDVVCSVYGNIKNSKNQNKQYYIVKRNTDLQRME